MSISPLHIKVLSIFNISDWHTLTISRSKMVISFICFWISICSFSCKWQWWMLRTKIW